MKTIKKVAFITGTSRGLGKALATKLSKNGYIVYGGSRNNQNKDLNLQDDFVKYLRLDITSEESIEQAIKQIMRLEGRIDLLVNNAATGLIGTVDSATKKQVMELFEVNVFGALSLTQRVIPIMINQKEGQIVFISSSSGIESCSFLGLYAATKSALESIAYSLATTLFPWNIDVSVIQPGAMGTKFCDNLEKGDWYSEKNNPYSRFTEISLNFLQKVLKNGQSTEEVSELIINSLMQDKPDFRIQIGDYSKSIANKYSKDPKGENFILEHKQLIQNWF